MYKKKKVCVWLCVLESICLWCMFFGVELKSKRVKPYFGRIVCFWCRKTLRGVRGDVCPEKRKNSCVIIWRVRALKSLLYRNVLLRG